MSLDRSRCRSSSRSPARRVGSIDAATSPSIASAIAAAAAASNGYTRRALVSFRERLQCSLTMLNLYGGGATVRWKVCADSVKKNPGKPWVALKAGQQLEVYDMERKVLVSKHKTSFPVIFWTWIGASVIALVSDDAVYHWDLAHGSDASSAQRRLFARHSRLDNAEIVSYVADDAHRWCALLGLIENDGAVQGVVQLYSTDERLSQPIDAHAVSFATYTFDGNAHPSTLLCVALRACGRSGKVHVVELGPHVKGNGALTTYSETIKFTANTSKYDFPIATEVSSSQRLVYIVTKYGHLFLCELETGMFLCQIQMSRDVIFATLLNSETQGVIGISRNGQVGRRRCCW
ncbi:PREDICTED: clathrin heavy chain 2-like isoform X2 [Priapulus caudatus]|uniref:Clathrin heavy chain 2-like isoform X2 n=1 Tax=Priapulus caudatus TaxID=37621 RepID=A0ABM1EMU6_PRICU|nr:PREDICTED: clathrin heavy chain 2-like isoform X2 [Priapulus caudatus]